MLCLMSFDVQLQEVERQKKIAQFQELFGCLEAEAVSMLEVSYAQMVVQCYCFLA